jgi:hypothetical protein
VEFETFSGIASIEPKPVPNRHICRETFFYLRSHFTIPQQCSGPKMQISGPLANGVGWPDNCVVTTGAKTSLKTDGWPAARTKPSIRHQQQAKSGYRCLEIVGTFPFG